MKAHLTDEIVSYGSLCVYECQVDKRRYDIYKAGNTNKNIKYDIEEMRILSVLENLGFPMNEDGTYLYKNMILKIKNYLCEVLAKGDNVELKGYLLKIKEKYSQFYFDVARNDMDMGISTYHNFVAQAVSMIDFDKADLGYKMTLLNSLPDEMDYGEFAFVLAMHLTGRAVYTPSVGGIKRVKSLKSNKFSLV